LYDFPLTLNSTSTPPVSKFRDAFEKEKECLRVDGHPLAQTKVSEIHPVVLLGPAIDIVAEAPGTFLGF
jgi:hypothetical protein